MPAPTCSKCRRVIPSEDINVAKDVAYCRECNFSYRLSELTFNDDPGRNVDLHRPPPGAWYRSDGAGTIVGATHRSLGLAAGALFFALFWNGIVSVFVTFAMAGTLHLLHLPLPAWFPAPKMNGGEMGPGMVAFLWLFLTPFIAVGLFVAGTCLSGLFGKTEVQIQNSMGTIFTGIGALGWRRNFDVSQVRDVRLERRFNREGQDTFTLLIETREGKQSKLGSLLSPERRQFLLGALRKSLVRD